ncbi:MAG: hypothetical protein NWF07_13775 [Candidatus Bathyarchaeota archaeon]|nr:hypothetical protein [Candidatus Bathyarchaeota archaeon]
MAKVWESFRNQKQWEAYLKERIKNNRKALYRSIIYVAMLSEMKHEHDGVGFSRPDLDMMDYAKKLISCRKLTPEEEKHAREYMPKYWKQIMRICKKKYMVKPETKAHLRTVDQLLVK